MLGGSGGSGRPSPVLGYVPALDGLRAIAILLVLWHHSVALLDVGVFESVLGGSLGVDVFFVLSGFLITTLLLERQTAGGIGLRAFYVRRAWRLLPALAVFLAAHAVVAVVAGRSLGTELRTIVAAVTYTTNYGATFGWHLAADQEHLWSLAVEEQFYLLWPLGLLVLVRRSRPAALWMVGAAVAIVAVWRSVLAARHGGGYPIVYPRFDARVDALLIGSGLAMAVRWGWRPQPRPAAWWGLGGLAVLAALVLRTDPRDGALYAGGFTVVAAATAAVILAVVASPGGLLARTLAHRALVAVGRRSYSLYLWHALAFTAAAALMPEVAPGRIVLAYGTAFAAAGISHRWIERPLLRGPGQRRLVLVPDPPPVAAASHVPAPPRPPARRSVALVASASAGVLLLGGAVAGAAIGAAQDRWEAEAAARAARPLDAPAEASATAVPPTSPSQPPAAQPAPPAHQPAAVPAAPPEAAPPVPTALVVATPTLQPGPIPASPAIVELSARLTAVSGQPLVGRPVRFDVTAVDGGTCVGITDDRGIAACSLTLGAAVPATGELVIEASFAGDAAAAAASAAWPPAP